MLLVLPQRSADEVPVVGWAPALGRSVVRASLVVVLLAFVVLKRPLQDASQKYAGPPVFRSTLVEAQKQAQQ